MQSEVLRLDVDQLKAEIAKTYTAASCETDREFIFPDWTRLGARPRIPG